MCTSFGFGPFDRGSAESSVFFYINVSGRVLQQSCVGNLQQHVLLGVKTIVVVEVC